MLWVWVFGGIALAGLVMLISYAVWLAHKAADVFGELAVLSDRAAQLADLLGQIRVPEFASPGDPRGPDWAVVEAAEEEPDDVR